jgi:hypothetical protein
VSPSSTAQPVTRGAAEAARRPPGDSQSPTIQPRSPPIRRRALPTYKMARGSRSSSSSDDSARGALGGGAHWSPMRSSDARGQTVDECGVDLDDEAAGALPPSRRCDHLRRAGRPRQAAAVDDLQTCRPISPRRATIATAPLVEDDRLRPFGSDSRESCQRALLSSRPTRPRCERDPDSDQCNPTRSRCCVACVAWCPHIAERYAALGANVVINYSTDEAQASAEFYRDAFGWELSEPAGPSIDGSGASMAGEDPRKRAVLRIKAVGRKGLSSRLDETGVRSRKTG